MSLISTYPRHNPWHDPNHVSNPNYPKKYIFVDHDESIERYVHVMGEHNRKGEKWNGMEFGLCQQWNV